MQEVYICTFCIGNPYLDGNVEENNTSYSCNQKK